MKFFGEDTINTLRIQLETQETNHLHTIQTLKFELSQVIQQLKSTAQRLRDKLELTQSNQEQQL